MDRFKKGDIVQLMVKPAIANCPHKSFSTRILAEVVKQKKFGDHDAVCVLQISLVGTCKKSESHYCWYPSEYLVKVGEVTRPYRGNKRKIYEEHTVDEDSGCHFTLKPGEEGIVYCGKKKGD